MAEGLRAILDQEHPYRVAMLPLWGRYRDFGESIDTDADKRTWLPQGGFESNKAYEHRLRLSHDLGMSPSTILRLSGALLRGDVVRDYGADVAKDEFARFAAAAGGVGTSIDAVLEASLVEALMMGHHVLFVGRTPTPEAATRAEERPPYVQRYDVEEVLDWDGDPETGALRWIVIRRESSRRASAMGERASVTTWLVADTFAVTRYEASGNDEPTLVASIPHGLGIVPVVVHYGFKRGLCQSRSLIDAMSRADLQALQLRSDNAISSYLHGNPRLKIRSSRPLDQISAEGSRALILDPSTNEDAEYVQLDASGMEIREKMLANGDRRAAGLANMDPGSFSTEGDLSARSGAALAQSFSAAEAPTLERAYAGLLDADREIHEIVARYLMPRTATPPAPTERVFTGSITRAKEWDFTALGELVETATAMWSKVKSPTWRREVVKQIATRAPGNMPKDVVAKVFKELDAASFEDGDESADPIA